MFVKTEGRGKGPGVFFSPSRRALPSSITESTDRSLESPIRVDTGTECLRDNGPLGGDDGEIEVGGEVERGGVADGEGMVAHSAVSGLWLAPFVPGSQDVIL